MQYLTYFGTARQRVRGRRQLANGITAVESKHRLYSFGVDLLDATFQQSAQSFVYLDLAVFGCQLQYLQILLAALGSAQILLEHIEHLWK